MTPEQIRALREGLPPFAAAAVASPELREFCRFYGLDFSADYPDAAYRAGLVPSGPYQLMVHHWLQPAAGASLLLVHGYFDHAGLFDKLVACGLSRGYNVLVFDLPGHGLSSGEPAAIDDFAEYATAVADVLAAAGLPDALPLFTVGQSTGCAALTEFARRYPWPFARAVYLAPLIRPAQWPLVRLGYFLRHLFKQSVPRRFSRSTSDTDFLAFIRRDPLQSHHVSLRWLAALMRWLAGLPREDLGVGPLLLVQGELDLTVNWRYNLKVIQKQFPGSEICYLPLAGHQLANESESVRQQYCAAIDRWFAREPASAVGAAGPQPAAPG